MLQVRFFHSSNFLYILHSRLTLANGKIHIKEKSFSACSDVETHFGIGNDFLHYEAQKFSFESHFEHPRDFLLTFLSAAHIFIASAALN
jgi:hypothetical protein